MNTRRTVLVVSIGLIVALGCAVLPPRELPVIGAPVSLAAQPDCPLGSQREGTLCTCPRGSNWTGSLCAPEKEGPDTRHVTTVDLRQRR